jgi:uncharacterized protein YbjT (DUF2867 family)
VTGATGKQGGALIDALVAQESQPFDIYAVTRDTYSDAAKKLEVKPNVRVIEGNFDDPDAIFEQADNLWGVFIVTTPMGKGGAVKEEEQGKAMVKAALKAGVKHIVYTSVDRGSKSDTDPTNIPHFISKKNVEDDIKAKTEGTETSWTLLRPVAFMDNLTNDFMGKVFVTMWNQMGMDTKLQLVGTKDIGRVAAQAFLHASEADYKNKAISLAGDDLSPTEAAKVFKEATGQDIPYTYGLVGTAVKWMMGDEVGKMFAWFKSTGYHADVEGLRKKYPFMKSFGQWLEEESAWRKT